MERYLEYLKKRFEGKTVEFNGYQYEFSEVKIEDETVFLFEINAMTPTREGGYVLQKIYNDLNQIISNFFEYFNKQFTISVHVFVNGKDVEGSYIPWEKIQEVFDTANQQISMVKFTVKKKNYELEVEYLPRRSWSGSVNFDDGVGFYVELNILKITKDGEIFTPDLNSEGKINEFKSFIEEHLEPVHFEDVMYTILEPELRLGDYEDLYYNAHIVVKYYKGKDIGERSSFVSVDELL